MYAEDLAQIPAGSGIAASVSVSPYESYSVDSVGCVLLVSLTLWLLESSLPLFPDVLVCLSQSQPYTIWTLSSFAHLCPNTPVLMCEVTVIPFI